MLKTFKNIYKNKHKFLTYFWIANVPVCILLYYFSSNKVMGLYIALCSVYANVESSAGAHEASDEI